MPAPWPGWPRCRHRGVVYLGRRRVLRYPGLSGREPLSCLRCVVQVVARAGKDEAVDFRYLPAEVRLLGANQRRRGAAVGSTETAEQRGGGTVGEQYGCTDVQRVEQDQRVVVDFTDGDGRFVCLVKGNQGRIYAFRAVEHLVPQTRRSGEIGKVRVAAAQLGVEYGGMQQEGRQPDGRGQVDAMTDAGEDYRVDVVVAAGLVPGGPGAVAVPDENHLAETIATYGLDRLMSRGGVGIDR